MDLYRSYTLSGYKTFLIIFSLYKQQIKEKMVAIDLKLLRLVIFFIVFIPLFSFKFHFS